MKAFVVTHVELGWDSVLAVFGAEEAAKEYVDWYSMYTITPKDVLIVHEQDYNLEFKEEDFK